jgi:hypothetical protein
MEEFLNTLNELRVITERSRPNIKYQQQMSLIEKLTALVVQNTSPTAEEIITEESIIYHAPQIVDTPKEITMSDNKVVEPVIEEIIETTKRKTKTKEK